MNRKEEFEAMIDVQRQRYQPYLKQIGYIK